MNMEMMKSILFIMIFNFCVIFHINFNYGIRSGAKTEELIILKKSALMNENSISQDGQIVSINIGQTTIRFNSIKKSYCLGLNEAFPSTSIETEFILLCDLFQKNC